MTNVLATKLKLFGPLPKGDEDLLDSVIARKRKVAVRTDIIREGDEPHDVRLVLEGMACRQKMLPSGERSIFAYLIPGDLCDWNIFILKAMDHTITTLSPCTIVDIPRERVLELLDRPAIARALWWATLVDEATLREWIVNIGHRSAETRVAHLFCEIHLRLKSIGLADGNEFRLPITQLELGQTMGLSTVHVNRVLQALRAEKLITFKSGQVVLLDVNRLRTFGEFNPNYLHLGGGKHDKATLIQI